MLVELGLPSFDTLLYNSRVRFEKQNSQNSIIAQLGLIYDLCYTHRFIMPSPPRRGH